jgi:hypothetical protein
MKQLMTAVITGVLCVASAHADEYAQQVADSRATVKEFMQQLKGELQKGMQEGGPVNAIGVCKDKAPAIAAALGERNGLVVGRTSLRVRNPANTPDVWEKAVLDEFEQRKLAGEDPASMEYYAAAEQMDKTVFRYMKAIPTAELCVACHGAEIPPDVAAKLEELYPQDKARGFQPGDIRGAFTITRALPVVAE